MEQTLLEILDQMINVIKVDGEDSDTYRFDPIDLNLVEEETAILQEKMGITPMQSLLFAVCILKSANRSMTIATIGRELGLNYLEMLSYSADFNALRDKGLISMSQNGELDVPAEVISSLMENRPFVKKVETNLSSKTLMFYIKKYLKMVKRETISSKQCLIEIENLFANNPETSVVMGYRRYVDANHVDALEHFFFLVMLNLMYAGRDYVEVDDIEDYFDYYNDFIMVSEKLGSDSLDLQKNEVIERYSEDGVVNPNFYLIKEHILNDLFSDFGGVNKVPTVSLKDCANKPTKHMFYSKEDQALIERLGNLLEPGQFGKVAEAMENKGLRTGFTCLFYGAPGTGKTETVYQLAKKTGRKILEADIARLKNCYVGEFEKNVRRLFHSYRVALNENELTPILLFNEADAILGKRMSGAEKSVDKMENAVQNILLQEMENFRGIMIATTNLTGNLDAAFERRFLYKVCFHKPDLTARTNIWKSMLADLSSDDALHLAENFDFSGGQIENVVRKKEIDAILNGVEPDYDAICNYCREESVVKGNTRSKIGFM